MGKRKGLEICSIAEHESPGKCPSSSPLEPRGARRPAALQCPLLVKPGEALSGKELPVPWSLQQALGPELAFASPGLGPLESATLKSG